MESDQNKGNVKATAWDFLNAKAAPESPQFQQFETNEDFQLKHGVRGVSRIPLNFEFYSSPEPNFCIISGNHDY